MSSKVSAVFRYLAYALEITVLFILGATPGLLPDLFGAKQVLLMGVALTVAVYEHDIPAMIIGAVCGALIDLGYNNSIGLFTITLTVVCFIVGYAANNLIMAKFTNFALYALIAEGAIFMLYFLVRFVWAGVDDCRTYFNAHMISRMVQTYLWSIPLYFLNKLIYSVLDTEN